MSKHALRGLASKFHRPSTRAMIALSTSSVIVASLLTVGAVTRSNASWMDNEHVVGKAGVVDCAAPAGAFKTRGDGQLVSGGLLGVDLDTVAEASGMRATNDGTRPLPNPAGANHANDGAGGSDPNAYVNPLDATALDAVDVNLGAGGIVDLASILQLPLNNSTGVLNQYGRAASDGTSAAGSGLVTDSGAVATADGSGGYPQLGSLDLKTLVGAVNPAVAAGLSTIADAKLTVGAVSGRSTLNGCDAAFSGIASALTREYLAAGLGANVKSTTVGALVTGLTAAVNGVQTAVNGLAGNAGVLSSITTGVGGLITGLLKSSTVSATVSATIDLSSVRNLLSNPFGDSGGLVSVNPSSGTVQIDLAALLARAYPSRYSNGLNGLVPNTHLLVDANVVNALTAALGSALDNWVASIQTALTNAVNAVAVTADVTIKLATLSLQVGTLTAHVSGSLQSLLAGTTQATTDLQLLGGINLGLLGLQGLVDTLIGSLTNGLGKTVGTAVNNVLTPLANIGSTAATLTAPVVSAIGGLFTALFVNGVVTLDVNSQNDPLTGNAEPVDWAGLPPGQYDVAALRIGILDALGTTNVHLYLGRASVGVICSMAGSGCAGY